MIIFQVTDADGNIRIKEYMTLEQANTEYKCTFTDGRKELHYTFAELRKRCNKNPSFKARRFAFSPNEARRNAKYMSEFKKLLTQTGTQIVHTHI